MPDYPLEALLAAERRQNAALATHFAERAAMLVVRMASCPYWPRVVTDQEALWDESDQKDHARRVAWIAKMGGRTSFWRPPAERAARRAQAVAMREAGASWSEIGVELGVSHNQARVLVSPKRRARYGS